MLGLVKKYWIELLAFGVVFTVLMIDCIPDYTWINTDCDGPHYTYSAKYLYPAHKTSAPLFLLLGNLFIRLPFGTDAWNFALLSVLATTITTVFIYLIIRHHTGNKWFGIAGVLVYGSSALVISQSIIIETYALVTMFGIAAYYFAVKKRWLLTAIMLGAGGAVHHLIGIPIIVLLIAYKELRSWKYLGVMALFLLFYLYIPLTNREPYMWQSPNDSLASSFMSDNLSTMLMLFGGLSIWDLPKRIFDTIGILAISFTVALIPIAFALKQWKSPLFWLFVLPIIYYMTDLAPQTYVYIMPGIAAGAILCGVGLSNIGTRYAGRILYRKRTTAVVVVVGITAFGMLIFNANYFDVGRTLDKDLAAKEFYDNELAKVPDGEILLATQGWEWAMIYPYNKEEERNIIPVYIGTLAGVNYREMVRGLGVYVEEPPEGMTLAEKQNFAASSIIANNNNVWATRTTTPETYGAEVIPSQGNEELVIHELPTNLDPNNAQWQWKPSNPYNIITGSIEVKEWTFIIFSNYSAATFLMLGGIGSVPCWIAYMIFIKKKKWSLWKKREQEVKCSEV